MITSIYAVLITTLIFNPNGDYKTKQTEYISRAFQTLDQCVKEYPDNVDKPLIRLGKVGEIRITSHECVKRDLYYKDK